MDHATHTYNHNSGAQSRDSILRNIFARSANLKRKRITFMGQEIDIKQPTIKQIMSFTDESIKDHDKLIDALIEYAYVPGTDERLFDETHREMLQSLPFNDDFTSVSEAIAELTTSDVEVAEKN